MLFSIQIRRVDLLKRIKIDHPEETPDLQIALQIPGQQLSTLQNLGHKAFHLTQLDYLKGRFHRL